MRIIMLFMLIVISSTVYSTPIECFRNLTDEFRSDSATYSLNLDEVYVKDYGQDHLANGIQIVRALLRELGCNRSDINFRRTNLGRSTRSRCREIIPSQHHTRVCAIESSLGYFFVTWDMQTRANIIFNRWD